MTLPFSLARLAMLVGAVLILIALVMWGPAACSRLIAEKEARKIESGQADATLDSLDIANATAAEREAIAEEIEAENKALADEIRAADPGDSNAAAVSALCRTRTYRDHPDCKGNADAP
jgi:hypothetical protein